MTRSGAAGGKKKAPFYLAPKMDFMKQFIGPPKTMVSYVSEAGLCEPITFPLSHGTAGGSGNPVGVSLDLSLDGPSANKKRRLFDDSDHSSDLESAVSQREGQQMDCPELSFFKGIIPLVKNLSERNKSRFWQQL